MEKFLPYIESKEWEGFLVAVDQVQGLSDVSDYKGWGLLHYAVEANAPLNVVERLLERGLDINEQYSTISRLPGPGVSVFSISADKKYHEKILKEARDPNTRDNFSATALIIACKVGADLPLAKLLIEKGADMNAVNLASETALGMACRNVLLPHVKLFLESGAEINNHRNMNGRTPLEEAIYTFPNIEDDKVADVCEIIKALITSGSDLNVKDKRGHGPLVMLCAVDGPVETAKLMIEKGADVNASDKDGWTPLCEACANNKFQLVRLLVEAGADVNKSSNDFSPLALAVVHDSLEIIQLLLDNGVEVNQVVGNRKAPPLSHLLLLRLQVEHIPKIAALLIARGANVNQMAKDDLTPLKFAATRWRYPPEIIKTCEILLKAGAHLGTRDSEGATLLHAVFSKQGLFQLWDDIEDCAVDDEMIKSNLGFIQWLIDHGADVNAKDKNGKTPLAYASKFNFLGDAAKELLVKHGAEPVGFQFRDFCSLS